MELCTPYETDVLYARVGRTSYLQRYFLSSHDPFQMNGMVMGSNCRQVYHQLQLVVGSSR